MKKRIFSLALAAALAASMSMTALAGEWKQDATGSWYQNDDGSYTSNSWQWIDGNNDGVAECYYFDGNGYMLANTTTPDGYTVDASGAWVVNGVVQTQGTATNTGNAGNTPTSQQIVDYLSNDKVDHEIRLEIDNSKQFVSSGSTNIRHKTGYSNGWFWHVYNKYATFEYYICALAFDENGYLLVNTTTPDGLQTNEYGILVIDGRPVVHSSKCKMFLQTDANKVYDRVGNLVTDKNNADLSNIDVNAYMMSAPTGYLVPFGQLVYNHCCYQTAAADWPYENGFGVCVEAQKAMHGN